MLGLAAQIALQKNSKTTTRCNYGSGGKPTPVIIDGKEYASIAMASEAIGKSVSVIYRRLKSDKYENYKTVV